MFAGYLQESVERVNENIKNDYESRTERSTKKNSGCTFSALIMGEMCLKEVLHFIGSRKNGHHIY